MRLSYFSELQLRHKDLAGVGDDVEYNQPDEDIVGTGLENPLKRGTGVWPTGPTRHTAISDSLAVSKTLSGTVFDTFRHWKQSSHHSVQID